MFVNNEILDEGSWTGSNIEIPLQSWAVGTYTVKLIVTDESNNVAESVVVVIIKSTQDTRPNITPTPFIGFFGFFIALGLGIYFSLYRKRQGNRRTKF